MYSRTGFDEEKFRFTLEFSLAFWSGITISFFGDLEFSSRRIDDGNETLGRWVRGFWGRTGELISVCSNVIENLGSLVSVMSRLFGVA